MWLWLHLEHPFQDLVALVWWGCVALRQATCHRILCRITWGTTAIPRGLHRNMAPTFRSESASTPDSCLEVRDRPSFPKEPVPAFARRLSRNRGPLAPSIRASPPRVRTRGHQGGPSRYTPVRAFRLIGRILFLICGTCKRRVYSIPRHTHKTICRPVGPPKYRKPLWYVTYINRGIFLS